MIVESKIDLSRGVHRVYSVSFEPEELEVEVDPEHQGGCVRVKLNMLLTPEALIEMAQTPGLCKAFCEEILRRSLVEVDS